MQGTDVKVWREGAMVTALNTGVIRALGRGQIFFGAAGAVFQVVLIAINSDRGVPFLAAGIWSGFFFLLAGFAALAAAARPTRWDNDFVLNTTFEKSIRSPVMPLLNPFR